MENEKKGASAPFILWKSINFVAEFESISERDDDD
jgi:hypothetical protein